MEAYIKISADVKDIIMEIVSANVPSGIVIILICFFTIIAFMAFIRSFKDKNNEKTEQKNTFFAKKINQQNHFDGKSKQEEDREEDE